MTLSDLEQVELILGIRFMVFNGFGPLHSKLPLKGLIFI